MLCSTSVLYQHYSTTTTSKSKSGLYRSSDSVSSYIRFNQSSKQTRTLWCSRAGPYPECMSNIHRTTFHRGSCDGLTISQNVSDRSQMSSIVENPSTLSSNHVKTPEYVDGEPITWLGNPALPEGALFEVGEYFTRNHTFQPLFEHRAALLPSGKVALTSAASIPFINKTIPNGNI